MKGSVRDTRDGDVGVCIRGYFDINKAGNQSHSSAEMSSDRLCMENEAALEVALLDLAELLQHVSSCSVCVYQDQHRDRYVHANRLHRKRSGNKA